MIDTAIIGAGCAGLTAAIYSLRAGLKPIIFEKSIYGGQIAITSEVENYPAFEKISGAELAQRMYNQAESLGADIRFEPISSVDFSDDKKIITTSKEVYQAKTVIIANGVKRRTLDCPGEKEYTGKGVSYCATCDGAFFRNRITAVVGGGNTALEDALYLANICKKVYLIHRRDTFRGEKALADSVIANENIEILYDNIVEQITGEKIVNGLDLLNKKTGKKSHIDINGVFIAIGLKPDNSMFSPYINTDENGYFIVDETCTTNIKGVFVAGDSRSKPLRQIVTATADGAVAAWQAANYLNKGAAMGRAFSV